MVTFKLLGPEGQGSSHQLFTINRDGSISPVRSPKLVWCYDPNHKDDEFLRLTRKDGTGGPKYEIL